MGDTASSKISQKVFYLLHLRRSRYGSTDLFRLKEMHEAGASTVAQDKDTCVIYGMPAVAVERGGVDRQLPLQSIPGAIMKFGGG